MYVYGYQAEFSRLGALDGRDSKLTNAEWYRRQSYTSLLKHGNTYKLKNMIKSGQ